MKRLIKASAPTDPFRSIPWLDAKPSLRRWFSDFLQEFWERIYWHSYSELLLRNAPAATSLSNALDRLFPNIRELTTDKQLQALDNLSSRCGLTATHERLMDQLHHYLTRYGQLPQNVEAYQASPWCNNHVVKKRLGTRMGFDLFAKCYPRRAELELALRNVAAELSCGEIGRADSGQLGPIRDARQHIEALSRSIKELPQDSAAMPLWNVLAPQLADLSGLLQKQMQELPRESRRPSRTERRVQRVLRGRVLQFLRMANDGRTGPADLARFIVRLLKESWPSVPAGLSLDPSTFFNHDSRRLLIRNHLGLEKAQTNQAARALWNILFAILHREELRTPLLKLARHANKTPKGWATLRSNLTKVFEFIRREPSKQPRVTDLMVVEWPNLHGKVDLATAIKVNKALHLMDEKEFDAKAEGKTSVEVMMRRARDRLRRDENLI